jgi:hypothetical protein
MWSAAGADEAVQRGPATIPLYSNVYYDFADNTVQEYLPNAHWSWSAALMYAYVGEALELPDLLGT